jgi:streptogramin lyase
MRFKTSIRYTSRLVLAAALFAILTLVSGAMSSAGAAGGALWMTSPDNPTTPGEGVEEVLPPLLKKSAAVGPSLVTITKVGLTSAAGLAFQHGNLWVTTLNRQLFEFSAKQLHSLVKSPNPTPAVIINSTAFAELLGCTFDKKGNLWIVDPNINGVHEISKAQLAAGSNAALTPTVTVTATATLASPAFAVFDKTGNLWISSEGNSKVAEFSVSQLASSGDVVPNIILTSASLDGPGQLQFDKKGNLWVTNAINSTVVEFAASDLGASGSPLATVILSANAGSIATPWGMQFDGGGNLWVMDYTTPQLVKFTKKELTATGSPTPSVVLTGVPLYAGQLTFGPPAK